jgi:hypothetical protein
MGDVVKLPGAARRQPPNHRFIAQHATKRALREAQPWPGEYLDPQLRDMIARAEIMRSEPSRPEAVIIAAIMHSLPEETMEAVMKQLAAGAHRPPDSLIRRAYEMARLSAMNYGEVLDWRRANDFLDKRES